MDVKIRDFEPGDEVAFRLLNVEWITRYFELEAKDRDALEAPHRTILERGGRILFAVHGGEPVGCCSMLPLAVGEFEIGKMAVTERCQRAGIGRKVLEAAIERARADGATRLYLETNEILTPARRLYESVGFRPVPPERVTPSPYARANVYLEMFL